ncbi:MAG: hypothetical protein AAFP84_22895, partial [Actinomycetota bacterium]
TPDAGDADGVTVYQPVADGERWIARVTVAVGDAEPFTVELDARSHVAPGQRIPAPIEPGTTVSIRIDAVTGGGPNGVGFREVDLGFGPTTEQIRTPDRLPALADDGQFDVVVTRLRAEATDRWRDDPEPVLRRRVPLPAGLDDATFDTTVTIRLDPRADDAAIARLLGDRAVASGRLIGAPTARGAAAVDGDPATAWVTPFGSPTGPSLTLTGLSGTSRRLTVTQPSGPYSPIAEVRIDDDAGFISVPVTGSPVDLPRAVDLSSTRITIVDADLRTTIDRRFGDEVVLPAAIAELEFDDAVTDEPGSSSIAVDCEPGWMSIDGQDVPISFRADADDLVNGRPIIARACGGATRAVTGTDVEIDTSPPAPFQIDRVVLRAGGGGAPPTTAPIWFAAPGANPDVATIERCPAGCWVVLGHGFNPAWRASQDGTSLGRPELVDGNANGWWLEPFDVPTTVRFDWTAQRPVDISLAISGLSVLLLVGALVVERRRRAGITPIRADRATSRPGL